MFAVLTKGFALTFSLPLRREGDRGLTAVEGEKFLESGHILDNPYRPIALINNR